MNERALAEVLDRCVEDIRAGRSTLAECLEQNPEAREDLAQVLTVALELRLAAPAAVDGVQQAAAGRAFREALAAERRPRSWWSGLGARLGPGPWRWSVAAAALTLALVGSGGGLAVASSQAALPGDVLYPVKTTVEQVQLATAQSPEQKAQVKAAIAQARLRELELAVETGRHAAATAAAASYAQINQELRDQVVGLGLDSTVGARLREVMNGLGGQERSIERDATAKGMEAVASSLETAAAGGARVTAVVPSASDAPTSTTSRADVAGATPSPTRSVAPRESSLVLPSNDSRTVGVLPSSTRTSEPGPGVLSPGLATAGRDAIATLPPSTGAPLTVSPAPSAAIVTLPPNASTTPVLTASAGRTATTVGVLSSTGVWSALVESVATVPELPDESRRSLMAHLQAAQRALEQGARAAALAELDAFQGELHGLYERDRLSDGDYRQLYARWAEVLRTLGETPAPVPTRALITPSPTLGAPVPATLSPSIGLPVATPLLPTVTAMPTGTPPVPAANGGEPGPRVTDRAELALSSA